MDCYVCKGKVDNQEEIVNSRHKIARHLLCNKDKKKFCFVCEKKIEGKPVSVGTNLFRHESCGVGSIKWFKRLHRNASLGRYFEEPEPIQLSENEEKVIQAIEEGKSLEQLTKKLKKMDKQTIYLTLGKLINKMLVKKEGERKNAVYYLKDEE